MMKYLASKGFFCPDLRTGYPDPETPSVSGTPSYRRAIARKRHLAVSLMFTDRLRAEETTRAASGRLRHPLSSPARHGHHTAYPDRKFFLFGSGTNSRYPGASPQADTRSPGSPDSFHSLFQYSPLGEHRLTSGAELVMTGRRLAGASTERSTRAGLHYY